MRFKRMCIIPTLVGAFFVLSAGPVLAAPTAPVSAERVPMGYCGPPVSSKAMMVAWYQANPWYARNAERYVRKHARYYHIQADQSFIAWLQMPNVKYMTAPRGYRVNSNTRCKPNGTVVSYNGRYNVSGIGMLWWCNNPVGYNCTPISKGYCRNFVKGKPIKPKPKVPKPAPQPQPPTAQPPGSCNAINSPGAVVCSTFYIIVTCGGVQIVINGSSKEEAIVKANQYVANNCNVNLPPPPPPPPVIPPPPPPPPPVQRSCSSQIESPKSDPTVANGTASVSSGGTVHWNWGDGGSSTGTSVSHKYATPAPGPAGSGVTYNISVSASFSDGQTIGCGGRSFFVPAPPPSGNTGPPPLP